MMRRPGLSSRPVRSATVAGPRPALWHLLIVSAVATAPTVATEAQGQTRGMVEWPTYGGDAGGMKYSPLADIDRRNVARLALAWSWDTGDPEAPPADSGRPARPGTFQATPMGAERRSRPPTPRART
jgi:quinoprotein glucose dehydrogenase